MHVNCENTIMAYGHGCSIQGTMSGSFTFGRVCNSLHVFKMYILSMNLLAATWASFTVAFLTASSAAVNSCSWNCQLITNAANVDVPALGLAQAQQGVHKTTVSGCQSHYRQSQLLLGSCSVFRWGTFITLHVNQFLLGLRHLETKLQWLHVQRLEADLIALFRMSPNPATCLSLLICNFGMCFGS